MRVTWQIGFLSCAMHAGLLSSHADQGTIYGASGLKALLCLEACSQLAQHANPERLSILQRLQPQLEQSHSLVSRGSSVAVLRISVLYHLLCFIIDSANSNSASTHDLSRIHTGLAGVQVIVQMLKAF